MKLDWRFWLGLYVGLRLCAEACRECKGREWEERLERLLSKAEEELKPEEIAREVLGELLAGF